MNPKITSSIWSDETFEALESGQKLAFVWLLTNSQTNAIGVCAPSVRRFSFETGLPGTVLSETMKQLNDSIVIGSNGLIWIRNFIRHQFGTGAKLAKNNIFSTLVSHVAGIKDRFVLNSVLEEYPEFTEPIRAYQALPKGLQAQGEGEGEGVRGGEGVRLKGECEGVLRRLHGIPPSEAHVMAYGATCNPPVSEQTCRDFFRFYEGIAKTNANGDLFWVTVGENPSVITNWKVRLPSFRPRETGKGRPEKNQLQENIQAPDL